MPSSTSSSDQETSFRPDSKPFLLVALLAAVAGGAVMLLNALDPVRDKDNVMMRAAASMGSDTRFISLGTSHVLSGIDPSIIWTNALNIATPGADYEVLLLILRHHWPSLTGLDALLLEADNICASNIGFGRRDFSDLYDYGVPREELPIARGWPYVRQIVMESPMMAPIFFSQRLTPRAWVRQSGVERVPRGPGFTVYTGRVTTANNGLAKIRSHEGVLSPHSLERNLKAMRKIIAMAHARDVPVIMLTLPHDEHYTANAGPVWHASFKRIIEEARAEAGTAFTWWNYDQHPDFTDDDFNDGHHVNEQGARKLSLLLREKLEQKLGPP